MHKNILLIVASLLAIPFLASASIVNELVVYEDDFSGSSSSSLSESTTDTGNGRWMSHGKSSAFKADGSVVTGSTESGIWLPVKIKQGKYYKLSAELRTIEGDFITMGFASIPADSVFYNASACGTMWLN